MCKKQFVISWIFLLILVVVSCSKDEKQDGDEEGVKALLVGLWESESAQGAYTGEYHERYDFRDNGSFTVYDYDNESGWYNDGEGIWEYEGESLTLTYTNQLDVFKVESLTENALILVKPGDDGNTTVTYRRIDSQEDDPDGNFTVVGLWVGAIDFVCSDGRHDLREGKIIFEADGTGMLFHSEEDLHPFNYDVDLKNRKVYIHFDDGDKKVVVTKRPEGGLMLTMSCPDCGSQVCMELFPFMQIREMTVKSTEGYCDAYLFSYDKLRRVCGIKYTSVDEGDMNVADISVTYVDNRIEVTGALEYDYPYSVIYTLNEDGTVRKSVSKTSVTGDSYREVLNFTYDSNRHLSKIRSSETSTDDIIFSWNDKQLNQIEEFEDKVIFGSSPASTPRASVNFPYFMIFRYDDDIVNTADNTALLYASMLDILGDSSGNLLDSAVRYDSDGDWSNVFQFAYEWDEQNRLVMINDHSNYGGEKNYDDDISISYY
jgi:hypothetical protein